MTFVKHGKRNNNLSCSIKEMAHEAFWTCCPFLVVNFSSKFRWFHPSDSPTGQALLSLSFLRGPFGNLLTANEAAPGLGWRYNSHCVTPLLWPRRCVLMFALQAAYPAASSQPRTNVGKQLLCLQPLSSFHFHPEVINFHFSGKKKEQQNQNNSLLIIFWIVQAFSFFHSFFCFSYCSVGWLCYYSC